MVYNIGAELSLIQIDFQSFQAEIRDLLIYNIESKNANL